MVEGEIKLLGTWPSPFVIRVKMILEQKGLSYEYIEQDVFNNKSELLLKHNPIYKKVPVLIHGDRSICESLVILQYIDENWSKTGPPLLPPTPYERAIARFWAVYIDDKLQASLRGILMAATEVAMTEKIADTHAALETLEGAFKNYSAGKDFFGGDSIGYLDIILGSFTVWIRVLEKISGAKLLDEAKVPFLVQWEKRILTVDYVNKVLPSVERLEEYGRALRARA
ncbi:Glutathione S-transferase family protein [Rhynchospora pubera]|uniref:Glutathione S-transferase n=1 Tax=Rhynchospora pubera TaxID=906938 RepID=A0AAV8ERT4_9POAL|nr:Glutathione S-transferase family protein [Rhynchospora pubera]